MKDTGNKQAAWRMDPSHSGLAATGAGRTLDDEPTFCCACKAAETRLGAYC